MKIKYEDIPSLPEHKDSYSTTDEYHPFLIKIHDFFIDVGMSVPFYRISLKCKVHQKILEVHNYLSMEISYTFSKNYDDFVKIRKYAEKKLYEINGV